MKQLLWLLVFSVSFVAALSLKKELDADYCTDFSTFAGCSAQDPKYLATKQVVESATDGPFKTINTLVNLCKNTKKRSKKEFLNTYLLQHNDAIQPLFDKNLFAEAFATSSAFLTLNFDYSFFINLETEYRKRSNWTEVLIAKRNRTLVFKNQNQLSAVGDSKFSTEEVYRIMAFEKRLLHGDDGEYKLTSYDDGHYFNSFLDFIAKSKIIDDNLLNSSFYFYAPSIYPTAFEDTKPEIIRMYLDSVVTKVLNAKYSQLSSFDCNAVIQTTWPRTISKLLEEELLPKEEARDDLDKRIDNTFMQIKLAAVELLHELDLNDPELNQKLLSAIPDLVLKFHEPHALEKLDTVLELLSNKTTLFKWDYFKALKAYKLNDILSSAERFHHGFPLELSANALTYYNWTDDLDDPTWFGTVGVEISRLLWQNIGAAASRTDLFEVARKHAGCIKGRYDIDWFRALDRVYEHLTILTAFSAFQQYESYNNKPTYYSSEAEQFFLARQRERKCSDKGTPIPLREFYGFINQFKCKFLQPKCNLWKLKESDIFVEPEQWSIKLNLPDVDESPESKIFANIIESKLDLTYRPCLDFHYYATAGLPESRYNAHLRDDHESAFAALKSYTEEQVDTLAGTMLIFSDLVFDGFREYIIVTEWLSEEDQNRILKKLEELKEGYDWKTIINTLIASKQSDYSNQDNYYFNADGKTVTANQVRAVLTAVFYIDYKAPAASWFSNFGLLIGKEIGKAFDLYGSQFESIKEIHFTSNYNRSQFALEDKGYNALINTVECINEFYGFNGTKLQCEEDDDKCNAVLDKINQAIGDIIAVQSAFRAHRVYIVRHGASKRPGGPLVSRLTTQQLFFVGAAQFFVSENQPYSGIFKRRILMETPNRLQGLFANFPTFSNTYNCPIGTNYHRTIERCQVYRSNVTIKDRDPFKKRGRNDEF